MRLELFKALSPPEQRSWGGVGVGVGVGGLWRMGQDGLAGTWLECIGQVSWEVSCDRFVSTDAIPDPNLSTVKYKFRIY